MNPWMLYWNDWLVRRFMRTRKGGIREYSFHGKRVPKDCPLSREEIRTYVKDGPVEAIKLIRKRGISIREAKDLLDSVRGNNTIWKPREVRR